MYGFYIIIIRLIVFSSVHLQCERYLMLLPAASATAEPTTAPMARLARAAAICRKYKLLLEFLDNSYYYKTINIFTCRLHYSNVTVSSNRYNNLDHTTACSSHHNRTVSLLLWHVRMPPMQPDHYLTLQLCEDVLLIYDLCKQYTEYPCFERDICRRSHELKCV